MRPVRVQPADVTAEWDRLFAGRGAKAALVPTHHATTNSRHPGTVFRGTTWSARRTVTTCPDCHGVRFDMGGPHSPHFANKVLVDCAGRPIREPKAGDEVKP